MGKFIDLTNQQFGKLIALRYERINNRTYWICQCNCAHKNITKVRADQLKNGNVQSCGKCLHNSYEIKNEYVKVITYNNNKTDYFLIDKEDLALIRPYIWYINDIGYVWTYIDNHIILIHRFIMSNYYDILNKEIDHKFHKTKDNRKSQLRICTKQENQSNKKYVPNATQFKGITIDKRNNGFRADIKCNKKKITLGTYINLKDAIIARVQAEYKYQGDFRYMEEDDRIKEYCNMSMSEILSYNVANKANISTKSVLQYSKDNQFIKEWKSGLEASKELNCNPQHIYDCCNHKRRTHHNFKWEYKSYDK